MSIDMIDILGEHYQISRRHAGFADGVRSTFRYAYPSLRVGFSRLNRKGPEPSEFLAFARKDIAGTDDRSVINALGNAKRAVQQAIAGFFTIYCLKGASRLNFPDQLLVIRQLEAVPTLLISGLNKTRNVMEHEYAVPPRHEVETLIEAAELFLPIIYQYLRDSVIGAYFGLVDSDECFECQLNPRNQSIDIFKVEGGRNADTEIGPIRFQLKAANSRVAVGNVPLDLKKNTEVLKYVNLLVYLVRSNWYRLHSQFPPGILVPEVLSLEVAEAADEHGRIQFNTHSERRVPESALELLQKTPI